MSPTASSVLAAVLLLSVSTAFGRVDVVLVAPDAAAAASNARSSGTRGLTSKYSDEYDYSCYIADGSYKDCYHAYGLKCLSDQAYDDYATCCSDPNVGGKNCGYPPEECYTLTYGEYDGYRCKKTHDCGKQFTYYSQDFCAFIDCWKADPQGPSCGYYYGYDRASRDQTTHALDKHHGSSGDTGSYDKGYAKHYGDCTKTCCYNGMEEMEDKEGHGYEKDKSLICVYKSKYYSQCLTYDECKEHGLEYCDDADECPYIPDKDEDDTKHHTTGATGEYEKSDDEDEDRRDHATQASHHHYSHSGNQYADCTKSCCYGYGKTDGWGDEKPLICAFQNPYYSQCLTYDECKKRGHKYCEDKSQCGYKKKYDAGGFDSRDRDAGPRDHAIQASHHHDSYGNQYADCTKSCCYGYGKTDGWGYKKPLICAYQNPYYSQCLTYDECKKRGHKYCEYATECAYKPDDYYKDKPEVKTDDYYYKEEKHGGNQYADCTKKCCYGYGKTDGWGDKKPLICAYQNPHYSQCLTYDECWKRGHKYCEYATECAYKPDDYYKEKPEEKPDHYHYKEEKPDDYYYKEEKHGGNQYADCTKKCCYGYGKTDGWGDKKPLICAYQNPYYSQCLTYDECWKRGHKYCDKASTCAYKP